MRGGKRGGGRRGGERGEGGEEVREERGGCPCKRYAPSDRGVGGGRRGD